MLKVTGEQKHYAGSTCDRKDSWVIGTFTDSDIILDPTFKCVESTLMPPRAKLGHRLLRSASNIALLRHFSVSYYTNCVSLKLISASLNVKMCIF